MGKKYLKVILFFVLNFVSTQLFAQSIDYQSEAETYAGDVLRYSLQYPTSDPVSIVMPSVSDATGFGAYQQNPASMALFKRSFLSFGLSNRYVDEDGTYLENTSSYNHDQAGVGNAGFVYTVPTARGNLTIGAGYSQSHDFNRAVSAAGRNNLSTITDSFVSTPSDSLFFAAFDTYAIDHVDPNDNTSEVASIFRVDSPYKGINQNTHFTEKGTLGEYSAFVATEFLKNLMVGASIGIITGNYSYSRDFLESDDQNDYDTQFEDENGNLVGVDNILVENKVDAQFSGFSLRVGAVYKVTPNVNIGASYQLKNTVHVEEDADTYITNTLDDGYQYNDSDLSTWKYKIRRPARANIGITAKKLSGFTLSASGEYVAYSDGEVRFDELSTGNTNIADLQDDVNSIVHSNLEDVWNLRFGLQYEIDPRFIPRIGYGYYPSPTGDFENSDLNGDRQFYSAGFSSQISENTQLHIGGQLGMWDDQTILYSTSNVSESIIEKVYHWNIMAGITFDF